MKNSGAKNKTGKPHAPKADSCCGQGIDDTKKEKASFTWQPYTPAIISFILLIAGAYFNNYLTGFKDSVWSFLLFFAAYLIVGRHTVLKALKGLSKASIFNEFFLMTLATIGAFAIGDYAEGVAVMLFYEIGELFNEAAVKKAQRSIKALLDLRPSTVTVLKENQTTESKNPLQVGVGSIIQVKSGERVALDGELLSETTYFNTSALTGESKPETIETGKKVLAGMLNVGKLATLRITNTYENSALAKILYLVQHSLARKAKTETFIARLAKIYTPIVFFMALGITFLPYFFVETYLFREWLYRGLVFLVISCPCALLVSIPLGYFGGIGAASKRGILFKGSNFLDLITKVNTIVFDKTGTLTKGVFKVQKVVASGIDKNELLLLAASLENYSNHPAAKAIVAYFDKPLLPVSAMEEMPGYGIKGNINGQEVLVGNLKLFKKYGLHFPSELESYVETLVTIAIDGKYAGFISIEDVLKEDAGKTIEALKKAGLSNNIMLSGDKDSITQKIAGQLSIKHAFGGLLPEDKVAKIDLLKKEGKIVAFVGDGINDAPVLALADVGIAMGGLGADLAIETADIVIQTDQPSKIVTAIAIGKATQNVVWQNIFLAFGVKGLVLLLGAIGIATLWEAVFADVGVALLAILNAVKIQKMKFE